MFLSVENGEGLHIIFVKSQRAFIRVGSTSGQVLGQPRECAASNLQLPPGNGGLDCLLCMGSHVHQVLHPPLLPAHLQGRMASLGLPRHGGDCRGLQYSTHLCGRVRMHSSVLLVDGETRQLHQHHAPLYHPGVSMIDPIACGLWI